VKFYLSGPMSGLPNHNFDLFEATAETLRARGLDVLSPHDKCKALSPEAREAKGYEYWFRLALQEVLVCDAIILLPGWERSRGARRELDIALDLNYGVWILHADGSMTKITDKGA
jgi:hypothetical protein